jgi:hypothetical protein
MVEHRTLVTTGSPTSPTTTARGVLHVHSTPRALAPHIEWAVAAVLGRSTPLAWCPQPVSPGEVRAELRWTGEPGSAAALASRLRNWRRLRAEVTEESTPGREGERYALTPDLGIFRAVIGPNGDVQVTEERLRGAVARSAGDPAALAEAIDQLLGGPWDAELEVFRAAADGDPVRWLHRTG